MRILIVEPEAALASFLKQAFLTEHYEVELCPSKSNAVASAGGTIWDAIILDLHLPDAAELLILKQIRVAKQDVAIVVLSDSDDVQDRVGALEAGADEYMGKPFSVIELSTRLRGLLRRQSRNSEALLKVGDLQMDRVQRTVSRSGRRIELTRREFALLEYLMRNAGLRISRELILQHVWGVAASTKTNLIDVYVAYLREKLGGSKLPPLIHTVRGVGYEISSRTSITGNNSGMLCATSGEAPVEVQL